MDYDGLLRDLWEMAYRAKLASGLGDRQWRMQALAFAEDCIDLYFEIRRDA